MFFGGLTCPIAGAILGVVLEEAPKAARTSYKFEL